MLFQDGNEAKNKVIRKMRERLRASLHRLLLGYWRGLLLYHLYDIICHTYTRDVLDVLLHVKSSQLLHLRVLVLLSNLIYIINIYLIYIIYKYIYI